MLELTQNEFMSKKFNTKTLKFLVCLLLFILLIGINNTYIYYTSLAPFGIGLVFSLFFIKFNGYVLGALYLLSSIPFCTEAYGIIGMLNVVIILIFSEYLKSINKLKISKRSVFGLYLLSIIMIIVCNIGDAKETLAMIVSVVLGLMFLFSCIVFLDATIGKGLLGNINLDEKVCGCAILLVFSIGICSTNLYIFNLGLMFGSIIILVVCKLCGVSITLLCGVITGLGFEVCYLDPIYISMFIVMCLGSIAFKCNWKILSAVGLLFSYIIFQLLFNMGISLGEILSVVLGGLVFIIIPSKILDAFAGIFEKSKTIAVKNIFNSAKKEIIHRVNELSKVFAEMDKVYRGMVKGNLSDEKAKEVLREEIISGVCANCENKDRCFRNPGSFMDNAIDTIINLGYEKEKLMLIDLPEYLTTNCIKLNLLIQYYNNLLVAYKDYNNSISNLDTSRVLIADQLFGVSKLLETLSKEVDINVSIDNRYEKIIKERLSYAGIICVECVVYEESIDYKSVNIIVKNMLHNDKKIEKIVSKVFGLRFGIVSVENSEVVGAVSVILKNTPKYDIAFGSAVSTKSGKRISGDNHSIIDIGDGKYLASICDGMGSGKEASSISTLTINLIENFYRAGFDNNIILSSINKLLNLNELENYSTIDLCMIDCRKNIYDFIKLGASNGYIKRDFGDVETIECSSLPVGVLENLKPHITKLCINPMDIVVLVSDGVSDILADDLVNIIKFSDTINPQSLADEIMSLALQKNGGVSHDDMTVVCVRVFEYV